MRILLISLVFMSGFSAFANTQATPLQLHAFNSKIAKLLNFNNSSNYNKITKNLSPKDKQTFQKILAKKKAQKVQFFPFMSFLYIKESKKQWALEVVSLEPLKIRMDSGKIHTIDPKNIRGSFPQETGKKTASLWSLLGLEAHAACIWGMGTCPSEPSEWAYLYSYAASSEIYAGNAPAVTDADAGLVAREAASFVNEFGINKINCKPAAQANSSNNTNHYVEVASADGLRSLLECNSFDNNCRAHPLDKNGTIRNLIGEKSDLDFQIVRHMQSQIDTAAGRSINPNALDVSCNEDECHFVRNDSSAASTISDSTMEKIAEINIATIGDRTTRDQSNELLTSFKEVQRLMTLHYPANGEFYPSANRGKAMYAMMACCGSTDCVKYVNEGRVQMNTNPTDSQGNDVAQ